MKNTYKFSYNEIEITMHMQAKFIQKFKIENINKQAIGSLTLAFHGE